MITGSVAFAAGIVIAYAGIFRWNVGVMLAGWCIAGAGVVVFLTRLLGLP